MTASILETASRAALEAIFDASVYEEHFAITLEEMESEELESEIHALLLECGANPDGEGAYQFASLEALNALMEDVAGRLEQPSEATVEFVVFNDAAWSLSPELATESAEPLGLEMRGYQLRKIAFSNVRVSPNRNPRRRSARAGIVRLARSIATRGLQQPVTVRPQGEDFELVFGYRRHAAIGYAIQQGWLPEDTDVVCVVRRLNDSQVTLAALTENEEREEVDLLDQAEGWARLRLTQTESAIADASGVTVNNVRRCLKVASGVCDEAKSKYRDGRLEWNALIGLSYGSLEAQREFLRDSEDTPWKLSAEAIKRAMTVSDFNLADARFTLEEYEAAGGKLETDLWHSREGTRLLSPEVIERLQRDWAEARLEALKTRGYAFAELRCGAWSWWSEFGRTNADDPAAGAVVHLREDLSVEVIEGVIHVAISPATTLAAQGSSPELSISALAVQKPKPDFSEAGIALIRRTRTAALQAAILEDSDPKLPLALAIMGLLGERELRFKVAQLSASDALISSAILEELERFAAQLPNVAFSPTMGLELQSSTRYGVAARSETFAALLALPINDLERLNRLLVATMVGDFVSATDAMSESRRRTPICDPFIAALAAHLGVTGGEALEVSEAYLTTISFRKALLSPYLTRAFGSVLAAALLDRPRGKLIAELMKVKEKLAGFMPPELDFATNTPQNLLVPAQVTPLEPELEAVAADD